MLESNIIPIDHAIESFHIHLNYNDRVIFSAKFGDGKTYFLNQFKKKYKNKYLFITIYPVNYQVEANKDIFELIKRDILFQLSKKGLITDKIDVNTITKAVFNKSNIDELIEFLTRLAALSGIPGVNLISKLATKFYEAKTFYDTNKKTTNKYLSEFSEKPGIYELDCYTQLITETIKYYKKNESKKVVFIIEDLDRIDPVHVFRILNIFSAHMDLNYMINTEESFEMGTVGDEISNNKYHFDKIITVCHYDNLRKIYAYTYGKDVDFDGYIDKFITHKHFEFSLSEVKIDYAITKICSISNIDKSFFEKELQKVKLRLRELSIRQILALLKNLDAQILNKEIKIFEKYTTSSRCSVTRLLVILQRLKNDTFEYDEVLNTIMYKNPKQTIKLINVMWGIKISLNEQKTLHAFYPGKDSYELFQINPKIENGEIIGIEKVQSEQKDRKAGIREDLVKDIFQELQKYIQ